MDDTRIAVMVRQRRPHHSVHRVKVLLLRFHLAMYDSTTTEATSWYHSCLRVFGMCSKFFVINYAKPSVCERVMYANSPYSYNNISIRIVYQHIKLAHTNPSS